MADIIIHQPWIQVALPQHDIVLTLLIRLNIAIILLLTNGPVFLYLPPHWVSFQMAALFSTVAVGEAALMMMTGSLKQAKHNALP